MTTDNNVFYTEDLNRILQYRQTIQIGNSPDGQDFYRQEFRQWQPLPGREVCSNYPRSQSISILAMKRLLRLRDVGNDWSSYPLTTSNCAPTDVSLYSRHLHP